MPHTVQAKGACVITLQDILRAAFWVPEYISQPFLLAKGGKLMGIALQMWCGQRHFCHKELCGSADVATTEMLWLQGCCQRLTPSGGCWGLSAPGGHSAGACCRSPSFFKKKFVACLSEQCQEAESTVGKLPHAVRLLNNLGRQAVVLKGSRQVSL